MDKYLEMIIERFCDDVDCVTVMKHGKNNIIKAGWQFDSANNCYVLLISYETGTETISGDNNVRDYICDCFYEDIINDEIDDFLDDNLEED